MAEDERIDLPKLQGHNCFACGTANPIGLNLRFYREGEQVCTDITLGDNHVGWENMAHGGIISTILDETMSWTILFFKRAFLVTRKMELKYIKPALIHVPLTAKGKIGRERRRQYIEAIAELFDDKGTLLARSVGQFLTMSKDKLSVVPEDLKDDMLSLFQRFDETL